MHLVAQSFHFIHDYSASPLHHAHIDNVSQGARTHEYSQTLSANCNEILLPKLVKNGYYGNKSNFIINSL